MIKVIHIVGARPQFMKLMPLYHEMKKNNFYQEILHTGQHFDDNMSKIFFDELTIPKPCYNLNINSLSHGAMTGRMIEQIEKILINNTYDYVIVYGDTNSTLAGAIASKKCNFKLIHIEAGVRNHDSSMPEEINRVITDRISDLLFCPTKRAFDNLDQEGFKNLDISFFNSGDLMFETLKLSLNNNINVKSEEYILFTLHRAENLNEENLNSIFEAINLISKDHMVVFPVHPSTQKKLKDYQITPDFELIKPKGYLGFLELLQNCKFLITDSGGAIRESYWLGKPSLSILKKPVWPELIDAGASINSDALKQNILKSFREIQNIRVNNDQEIFGNGETSIFIVRQIINDYGT